MMSAHYHGTDPFGPWTSFALLCAYAAAFLVAGGSCSFAVMREYY
jgi:hypothetical protein